jgi:hypothetical protein
LTREAIELAGDERTPVPLESKGKLRILYAEENETISCSKAAGIPIIENEQNFSEDGVLYNERR